MNILNKISRLSWKNFFVITAVFLAAFLIMLVLCIVWDRWDFNGRSGRAEAAEEAEEDKLWGELAALVSDQDKYLDLMADSVSLPDEDDDTLPFVTDNANSKAAAARFALQLREHRKNILLLPDNKNIGYRGDALMFQALVERLFHINMMGWEIRNNAEDFFKRRFNNKVYDGFYNNCVADIKDKDLFLERTRKDNELSIAIYGLCWSSHLCAFEHGGYKLYQGCQPDALYADYSRNKMLPMEKPPAFAEAKLKCLERRRQNGSAFASVCRPVRLNCWYFLLKCFTARDIRQREASGGDFIQHPAEPFYLKLNRTAEDRLWNTAKYLALSTDNYLWTIKFCGDQKDDRTKNMKLRIRPLYAKNSKEMRDYAAGLASDLQDCRRKIKAEEFKYLPDMQKSSLELCSAAETILRTWNSYSQGKTDYKAFCAALKKNEALFGKVRMELLRKRWDYLSGRYKGERGYIISSLVYDGADYQALKQLIAEKRKQPSPPQT